MRTKVLNASVAVLMTAGVVTAAPSAAADDWKVEGDGDSAGISHRQEIGLPGVSRTVVDCVGQAALLLLTKSCSASLGVRYPSAE